MKRRLITTWFWEDDEVQSVSKNSRLLWIYLLTNKELGMTNYVKIPDVFLCHFTQLTPTELTKAKQEIEKTGRIFFYKDWIYIINLEKHNNYRNSPKNEDTYNRELGIVPEEVKSYFTVKQRDLHTSIDSSIDTSRHTDEKSEIRNKKLEQGGVGGDKSSDELKKYIEVFNQTFGKQYRSFDNLTSNYKYWRGVYSADEILEAVRKSKSHQFWGNKMTPTILLRRKNTGGESVDYIGEMLNMEVVESEEVKIKRNYINELLQEHSKDLEAQGWKN